MKEQIEKIIREAGAILMEHFGKTTQGNEKSHKGDLVSKADLESEQCIVSGLQKLFPNDFILAEENQKEYMRGKSVLEAGKERLWIIDALDGSRNLLRQIPAFSISVALIENDIPRFGIVYSPCQNELFWAEQKGGAFCSDQPIKASREQALEHSIMSTLFHDSRRKPDNANAILTSLNQYDVWRMNWGGVVHDGAYVACGRIDSGLWTGLYQWDTAATGLILQEAGAKVTDLKGNPWYWGSDPQDIVAANSVLHKKIMREIVRII